METVILTALPQKPLIFVRTFTENCLRKESCLFNTRENDRGDDRLAIQWVGSTRVVESGLSIFLEYYYSTTM